MDTRLLTKLGTLRQLEIFMKVAEAGSIAKAAEQLYLTQPSVSIQVKNLSEAMDIELYEVIGKKIHLTDAGKEVVKTGEEVFDAISRLDENLNNLKGLQSGTLRLAVVTTAKYFVPAVLGPFINQYPGIDVEFKVGNRAQIIERMSQNLDDLYIFSDPPDDLGVTHYEFLPNPIAIIASEDNPLSKEKNLEWEDLNNELFLMREQGSGTAMAIEQHLDDMGLKITRKMIIESNEAIKYAVIANMGIAILSAYVLARAKEEGLAQLSVKNFPILSHWYVAHLTDKKLSLLTNSFLNHLLENSRDLLPMEKINEQVERALSYRP